MTTLTPDTLKTLADGALFVEAHGIDADLLGRVHAKLLAHVAAWEADRRNYIERRHIDATPNDGLPLRILQAYRNDSDLRYSESTGGIVENSPLIKAMNDLQDQRATILDHAISMLQSGEADRRVIHLLVGTLSTFGRYSTMHPDEVLAEFAVLAKSKEKP